MVDQQMDVRCVHAGSGSGGLRDQRSRGMIQPNGGTRHRPWRRSSQRAIRTEWAWSLHPPAGEADVKIILLSDEAIRLEPEPGPMTIEAQDVEQQYSPFHMLASSLA